MKKGTLSVLSPSCTFLEAETFVLHILKAGLCSGTPIITTTVSPPLWSPLSHSPSSLLCRFLKQRRTASWVLNVTLLNIAPHHTHTALLRLFATFEASENSCLALPSSCFLPVCSPWLCSGTREGFSDAFLSWEGTSKDTGSSAGKADRGAGLGHLVSKQHQL